MPVIPRITFFFQDINDYGWSETHYCMLPTLAEALAVGKLLMPTRTALLGLGVKLTQIRVSDDLIPRDSLVYFPLPSEQVGPPLAINSPSDIANTSIDVRIQSGTLFRRTLYIRGQPDVLIDNSGIYTPATFWTAFFAGFRQYYLSGALGIKCRNQPGTPNLITTITQDSTTGTVRFVTSRPHGFSYNDLIVLKGIRGISFLNGVTKVWNVIDASTFEVKSNRFLTRWNGGGICFLLTFTLQIATDMKIVRAGHRIAGRPSVPRRGRRKAIPRA